MPELSNIFYTGAFGLVLIGLLGMALHPHLLRMLLALALAESGANLLLLLAGFHWDSVAPILQLPLQQTVTNSINMVDPVPQAMVLTAIVIGVGVQALALSILIRVYREHGSLQRDVLMARLQQQLDSQAEVDSSESQQAPGELSLPNSQELRS